MHVSLAALGELMVGATGLEGVDPEIIDVSLLTSGWNYFQLLPLLCLRAPVSAHRRVCVCIVCVYVCVEGDVGEESDSSWASFCLPGRSNRAWLGCRGAPVQHRPLRVIATSLFSSLIFLETFGRLLQFERHRTLVLQPI